jgi:hypothetical protein
MARYKGTIESRWPAEKAFAYMADFSKVPEWDESFERAERLTPDPLAVGARFRLYGKSLGRAVEFDYETVEMDAPRLVVLRTETKAIVSLDRITVEESANGGSLVTYDADLRPKGAIRLFALPLRLWFRRIGDRAKAGLERELNT